MKTAEYSNNNFANIGKTTSQNAPNGNSSYTNYLDKPIINSMFMNKIDYLHVMDKLIKEMISNIIHLLTYIINRFLNIGIVPDQLKLVKVIPVFKASDADILAYL